MFPSAETIAKLFRRPRPIHSGDIESLSKRGSTRTAIGHRPNVLDIQPYVITQRGLTEKAIDAMGNTEGPGIWHSYIADGRCNALETTTPVGGARLTRRAFTNASPPCQEIGQKDRNDCAAYIDRDVPRRAGAERVERLIKFI